MQDLIHAYLDHALASAVGFLSNKFDALQKVNLPLLWVVAPLSMVIAVLSCGDIPFRTQVGLRCNLKEGPSLDDYASLSSLLAHRFNSSDDDQAPAPLSPTIRPLAIKSNDGVHAASFRFRGSERDFHEWDYTIPSKFDLGLSTWTTSHMDHTVSNTCCSTPFGTYSECPCH